MKTYKVQPHFRTVIDNAYKLPDTSKAVLYERLDLIKLNIFDRVMLKVNLIKLYAIGTGFMLVPACFYGNVWAMGFACLFTYVGLVIQNDLNELIDYKGTIDKLREPEIGTYRPASISPFWY